MTTTKQSGGLPEKHKAHLSRPPIAKNITTIINNAVQGARCKVQGAKMKIESNVAFRNSVIAVLNVE